MAKLLVIQYEQFFELDAPNDYRLTEEIRAALQVLREQGGARVVGSYETEDTAKWQDKAVSEIIVLSPTVISVD